jgi:uncharacterized protein
MVNSVEAIDTIKEDVPVTAIINHVVRKGREEGYEVWFHGIAAAARLFQGHQGVSSLCLKDSSHPEYVVILKFDRYHNLKTWLESDIRKEWIDRLQPLIEKSEPIQTRTGLETWFTLPHQKSPPPRYKIAIVSWLGVFVLMTVLNPVLAPILMHLPRILAQLILTGFIVLILTYLVMPYLTKQLESWLYPKQY